MDEWTMLPSKHNFLWVLSSLSRRVLGVVSHILKKVVGDPFPSERSFFLIVPVTLSLQLFYRPIFFGNHEQGAVGRFCRFRFLFDDLKLLLLICPDFT